VSFYVPAPDSSKRDKLGVSLAGGGFRASLFHLGVLHRMAEMDLLRYIEVLSTVSGGSIVGALYVLMLQERLNAKARLDRCDYVKLVEGLEATFVPGVQKDLRTRLLMNPLGVLGVLLSYDSLGRRMGRIYARYLYKEAVDGLRQQDPTLPRGGRLSTLFWPISSRLWPGWLPLRSVHFRPGGVPTDGGLDGYNQSVLDAQPRGSAIPNFIMNSTALNSGAPFRFSSVEVGDPRLGYFRYDEADLLEGRKQLLDCSPDDLRSILSGADAPPQVRGIRLDLRVVALALSWITRNTSAPILPPPASHWANVFGSPAAANVLDSMCKTNFGRLRQLKLPAWYARKGPTTGVVGGVSVTQSLARFNQVLRQIEPAVSDQVTSAITRQDALGKEMLDLAVELYYLRSAEVMSWRLRDDFESISLATAVAASANFPPVFPPLVLLGIYDDLHVARLGLSDGGVYDNLGITTLLDEGCSHIIASDTGAPFDVKKRISPRYFGMIARLPDVLTDDVADQQHTQLRERRRVSAGLASYAGGDSKVQDLKAEYGLDSLAFFSIESENPPGGHGIHLGFDPCAVAALRTDLDSFGDLEVAALINAGYDQADRFLHSYLEGSRYSAPGNSYWNSPAVAPRLISQQYLVGLPNVLTVGQSRFFRSLRLWSLPSWIFTIALVAIGLYLVGFKSVSIAELVNRIPAGILHRLENPLPIFPGLFINRWARRATTSWWPVWQILVALVSLALILFKGWPWMVERFRRTKTAKKRQITTVLKWGRAFAPALFLLVAMTPVWIAAASSAIAVISYVAYSRPFLQKTRMRLSEDNK
jgi:predicted acylesterase/phospholipase RssA